MVKDNKDNPIAYEKRYQIENKNTYNTGVIDGETYKKMLSNNTNSKSFVKMPGNAQTIPAVKNVTYVIEQQRTKETQPLLRPSGLSEVTTGNKIYGMQFKEEDSGIDIKIRSKTPYIKSSRKPLSYSDVKPTDMPLVMQRGNITSVIKNMRNRADN